MRIRVCRNKCSEPGNKDYKNILEHFKAGVPKTSNDDSHVIHYSSVFHVCVQNGSDVKWVDGGKPIFKVSTSVLSTVYTQVKKSHSLRLKVTVILLMFCDFIIPVIFFAGPPSKPLLPAVPKTRGRPLSTSYLKLPQLP